MTDAEHPTAPLTDWDRLLLAAALGRMPHLPYADARAWLDVPDVASLAALLGRLADVLDGLDVRSSAGIARELADARDELAALRADVNAARRLLGLPLLAAPPGVFPLTEAGLNAAREYAAGQVRPARDYEAPNGGL